MIIARLSAAAAALALSTATGALAAPNIAPINAKAEAAPQAAPADADAQRCVTVRPTGSIARKRKLCGSKAEWARARDKTQDAVQRAQRTAPHVYQKDD